MVLMWGKLVEEVRSAFGMGTPMLWRVMHADFAFSSFFAFVLAIRFKVRRIAMRFVLADRWMKDWSFNLVQMMAELRSLLEEQGGVKTVQVATEYFHVYPTHSHLLLCRVLEKPCH